MFDWSTIAVGDTIEIYSHTEKWLPCVVLGMNISSVLNPRALIQIVGSSARFTWHLSDADCRLPRDYKGKKKYAETTTLKKKHLEYTFSNRGIDV